MVFNSLFGSLNFGGGGMIMNIIVIGIGAAILSVCGFGLWFWIKKKKHWNIKIEFKIPRNIRKIKMRDGTIKVTGTLNKEWGKGLYDATRGCVYVQRKGKKPVSMKPFDVKQYLSSGNILTVIQTGIEDYRPVRDESYIELVDERGRGSALVEAIIDTSESKSWKNTFEREAKMAYTIKNWLQEHGALVAMGLVLFMNLIGFAIVISRMPK
jgi:hypothetical protein